MAKTFYFLNLIYRRKFFVLAEVVSASRRNSIDFFYGLVFFILIVHAPFQDHSMLTFLLYNLSASKRSFIHESKPNEVKQKHIQLNKISTRNCYFRFVVFLLDSCFLLLLSLLFFAELSFLLENRFEDANPNEIRNYSSISREILLFENGLLLLEKWLIFSKWLLTLPF